MCVVIFLQIIFINILFLPYALNLSDLSTCGISEFEPLMANVPKIGIGINNVYLGQAVVNDNSFPWMASLKLRGKFLCTSTIVGPMHILTAMHCVKDNKLELEKFQISYGSANVTDHPQSSAVDSIELHPKAKYLEISDVFHGETPKAKLLLHDIAIIKLKARIKFAPNVRPICLFSFGAWPANFFVYKSQFIIAGWGMTQPQCLNDQKATPHDQLVFGKMRMISAQKCREMANKKNKSFKWSPAAGDDDNAIESMVNAFENYGLGNNICVVPEPSIGQQGDSGSPLMIKIGTKNWLQVGVATKTSCNSKNPTNTEGLFAQYTPIDCAWIAKTTKGEVKCYGR